MEIINYLDISLTCWKRHRLSVMVILMRSYRNGNNNFYWELYSVKCVLNVARKNESTFYASSFSKIPLQIPGYWSFTKRGNNQTLLLIFYVIYTHKNRTVTQSFRLPYPFFKSAVGNDTRKCKIALHNPPLAVQQHH